MDESFLRNVLVFVAAAAGVALVASALLLAITVYQLRRLRLPPGLGFVDTLRAVPVTLVIGLDLLDLALDIFAAPIAWILLGRLNLHGLRTVTTLESLVPFTQAIPTLTLAWLAVRVFNLRGDDPRWRALGPQLGPGFSGPGQVVDVDPRDSGRRRP
jgi:hypothetical protein